MIYYSDLIQIIYSWANDLNNVEGVTHEMEPQTDRFVISFNNGRTLTVGCSIATISIDQVWIQEPNNTFCEVHNNSEIRNYFTYNSYGFNGYIFASLRKVIRDFTIKDRRDKTIRAIDDGIKEWLSHLDSSFLHDREEAKGVTPAYDGIKYTIYKVEPNQSCRFCLTIGHANTIDLFINDKSVFYCIVNENRVHSFTLPPNIPRVESMTKDEFMLLIDYVKKHVDALNKKPEPKISTMDSSEQKPDTTDEQLLKSSNVKSFDELFEQLSSESIKCVSIPVPDRIIPAIQNPDTDRQMMHHIKPIVINWLKHIVYSAGPFSSFEEVSANESASLKYSFILHGERDANISMEIPYGYSHTIFIVHDGCKIMRIGSTDVILLMPLCNIDPDIQINRLHHVLYDVLNIKQRRSKIDEIIKCITFFLSHEYPDTPYSIIGKQIHIIKRDVRSDAPDGLIRIGLSYKPGYQLYIWKNNNYDNPFIAFDDNWKPIILESQDKFAHKLYDWLRADFGCEEDPRIISDSLSKSLCGSYKSIIPFRSMMTHNFKTQGLSQFEDAGLIMKIVKERNIMQIPGIKNVLFNDTKRTTTVLFDDGTKTMSKTKDGETYDREIGFAMCIMKKMYGNRSRFQKEIKKWTAVCENANKKIADKAAKKQDKNEKEVES